MLVLDSESTFISINDIVTKSQAVIQGVKMNVSLIF